MTNGRKAGACVAVGQFESAHAHVFFGVIPSVAVFQAERGISRVPAAPSTLGRSLGPLVKARAFGMTPSQEVGQNSN